jgi:hypothetical protein
MAVAKKKVVGPQVSALAKAVAAVESIGGDRQPLFDVGTHVCTFNGLEQKPTKPGSHEWLHAKFTLENGDEVVQMFCASGKSVTRTAERLKQLCMVLSGAPSVEEYNAFDPHGEFVDALLGFENRFTEAAAGEGNVNDYIGSTVVVKITKGNATEDGDFYREPSFSAAEASE